MRPLIGRTLFWSGNLFLLILLGGCLTARPEPAFSRHSASVRILSGLAVYAEPGIEIRRLQTRMEQIVALKHHLEAVYFSGTPIASVTLVVFHDPKTYSSFVRSIQNLPIRAHYDRSLNRIYIPLNAPLEVWKHELTHALLTQRFPTAPFWLQEGLARFIQRNDFDHPPDCVAPREAQPPLVHPRALEWLRHREFATPGRGFRIRDGSDPYFAPALGAYFVYYLWDRHRLSSFLKSVLHEPGRKPGYFLIGTDPGRYEEMDRDFHRWLMSDRPAGLIRGC